MTIDVTSALGNNSGATAAKKKADENSPEAIQERFMSLLVAQLKNQDPLAPMDNAQVTSQMAQLNTVTGINTLNATMQGVAASINANQTVQATSMLGRAVLTEGNDLKLARQGCWIAGIEPERRYFARESARCWSKCGAHH